MSVLIPTYNRPKLLRRALLSVLRQTTLPDEVIILDDNPKSTDNYEAVKDLIEQYCWLIRYEKNERNLGVVESYLKLLKLAKYEYVKFLADDDWLHPEALEKMKGVLDKFREVALVSSRRIPVNEDEECLLGVKAAEPLCEEDQILDGKEIIKKSFVDLRNYVGEFSTFMFRKSLLDINPFHFCGLRFRANADWILWSYLLTKGKLFYFSQPLSFFTVHSRQDQANLDVQLAGLRERVELILNEQIHRMLNVSLTLREIAQAVEKLILEVKLLVSRGSGKEEESLIRSFLERYSEKLCSNRSSKRLCGRPSFSVIVVTYNSSSTIEKLLSSLKSSLMQNDEVIIIDNNSQDETFALVKRFIEREKLKNFRILKMEKNFGYAKAVNEGVKVSRNDYLVFVNPDTVLPDSWTEIVYENLKDDKVGAVGALSNFVLSPQHLVRFSNFSWILKGKEIVKYINLVNEHLNNLYGKDSEEKKLLVGFFLATKREVFEKVGGFDEELFLGMDDLDYSLKVRKIGLKLLLPKNLFVYHEGHVSFKKNRESEKHKKLTENIFAEKLIKKYGFGNVPTPEELWGEEDTLYFDAFVPIGSKYKFMFRFSDKKVDFQQVAKEIARRPKVGIVTVSYYSSNDLELMAESLKKMSYQEFEWYIVDHSENEEEVKNLRKVLSTLPSEKVFLFTRENKGYAAGVNFGVEKALENNCEYIWILNPDVVVEEDTLLELLKTLLFTDVPVVTCKIRDLVEKDKLQYDGFKVSYTPFPDYLHRIRKVRFLSGANIFATAEVLKTVKFDERYFLYFEDNDFMEKLLKRGIVPLYTPYTSVYHKNKKKSFLTSPLEVYYFFRNHIFYSIRSGSLPAFEKAINDVLAFYKNSFTQKRRIKALVAAIYDGVFGFLGKRDSLSHVPSSKKRVELLREYLEIRKVSKVLALEKGRDYLLTRPRDVEVFSKYLNDAFLLVAYSGERVYR
ncbi:glycosyltransferase family 2 protein [Phorcysia thermohydrogeniphila]|uniref:glycosyltransferase family 2 protein n=1 Tax=Phorcysia thermohydrogeniphila TaxID=936138 RepID=UPI001FB42560|nr:glycosyltransferase [Phorcysia thermohydrogeniphila]